jgi:FtsZ-binding cell division protein ZapB
MLDSCVQFGPQSRSRSAQDVRNFNLASLVNSRGKYDSWSYSLSNSTIPMLFYLQIKDKMLDSQNASISDLKAEVARCKAALQEAEEAAGQAASEWKERLRDDIEQVSLRQ